MQPTGHHLAELNVGRGIAQPDEPRMAEFTGSGKRVVASLLIGLALLGLTGCGPESTSIDDKMFEKVTRQSRVSLDGNDYEIVFKPYAAWIEQERDTSGEPVLRSDGSAEALLAGLDAGSPSVEVARADGVALTAADEENARLLALEFCDANPDVRRDGVFSRSNVLDKGVWKFFEICT